LLNDYSGKEGDLLLFIPAFCRRFDVRTRSVRPRTQPETQPQASVRIAVFASLALRVGIRSTAHQRPVDSELRGKPGAGALRLIRVAIKSNAIGLIPMETNTQRAPNANSGLGMISGVYGLNTLLRLTKRQRSS
jgi:hypothetical protein